MRRPVSSATPGCPLIARLAVATETPTALATSRMPTGLPRAALSVVMGSSAGGVGGGAPGITLHDATRHGKSAQRTRVRAAGPGPPRGVTFRKISHIQNLYSYMVLPYSR